MRGADSDKRIDGLLARVKEAGEDFEWYPMTASMVAVIARHLDKHAHSLMDIGAGDGRVLTQLAAHFEHPPELYAIEKSQVLIQAQPEEVIPVGTELFEQNLACLPVDFIFSNPPYSEYETWACMIIETGHARRAYLVIPQRWKDNARIADAIKKRGARVRVIHSADFHDAPRKARAVVDIVEVVYPMKEHAYGSGLEDVRDPFDIWFDQNIDTFEKEEGNTDQSDYQLEQSAIARIRHLSTIEDLVAAYREEYERMEENYRAIFRLDYALLKELGVSKDGVRDGIKKKMAGLKSAYWAVLFERLAAVTDRLTTATRKEFLERLVGRSAQAFTSSNAYAVVVWAIKNANRYFDRQTTQLYKDLSTFDGVLKYASNQRTWERSAWRYSKWDEERQHGAPSHYALDYRIVLERFSAITASGSFRSWESQGNLDKSCHETIGDVVAVMFNLGFVSDSTRSQEREWISGEWQDWQRIGHAGEVLFQVKAYKKGTLHFRFQPEAIKALNVEAGRLLGWLKGREDVVEELGYTSEEAERLWTCTQRILPASGRKLLGDGKEEGEAVKPQAHARVEADDRMAALLRAKAKRDQTKGGVGK